MISHPLGLFYHAENDNRILQCEEVMSILQRCIRDP